MFNFFFNLGNGIIIHVYYTERDSDENGQNSTSLLNGGTFSRIFQHYNVKPIYTLIIRSQNKLLYHVSLLS